MTNRPIWVGTVCAFLVQILPVLALVGLLVLVSSPGNPLWAAVLISAIWLGGGGVAARYWTKLAKSLALKWPRPSWPLNPDLGERPGPEFPRLYLDWPVPGSRGREFYEKAQKWANIWRSIWIFVWNCGFVGTLLVLLTYFLQ